MYQMLIISLAGVSVGAFAFSLFDTLFSEERRVQRRLKHLADFERSQIAEIEPLANPFARRVIRPFFGRLTGLVRRATPSDYRARVLARLVTAGRPGAISVDGFIALKIIIGILVAGAGLVIASLADLDALRRIVVIVAAAAVGALVPDAWLSARITERKSRIRRALPDMLDMLMIAVEAGLGFDAAISKLITRSSGPLAEEFAHMLREIQAGMSRREALHGLAKRTDVPELNAFVMAIVQADVFGVSIAKVLRTQSHELRVKRRQHAEEIAQKAPAKMVFPLVLCILPATLVVLLGPAVIAIGRAFGAID